MPEQTLPMLPTDVHRRSIEGPPLHRLARFGPQLDGATDLERVSDTEGGRTRSIRERMVDHVDEGGTSDWASIDSRLLA